MTEVALPTILERGTLTSPESLRDVLQSPSGAIVLVNKVYGDTSFHVVHQIRKRISPIAGIKRVKVGHAGTLDPLATGLLLIATRGATKSIATLTGMDKVYTLRLRLGITSASFDLESPIHVVRDSSDVTAAMVEAAVRPFEGASEQIPPAHSAIKQGGQPVYLKARAGISVTMAPRSIVVYALEVVGFAQPYVDLRVHCTKGTYIRSLVRDIGERLETGAVLVALERTAVGPWKSSDAFEYKELLLMLEDAKHHSTKEQI